MVEIHKTAEGAAQLWNDGEKAGFARWEMETLTFGREHVTVAARQKFDAEDPQLAEFLMAYLEDQWKLSGAAAWKDEEGTLRWYSRALEALYQKHQNKT